jgi:hypothetical protein
MSCNTCTALKPVNACHTNLNIGTSTHLATALKVYAENLATGKTTVFDSTTTGGGRFLITGFTWLPNVTYKIWATLATAESTEEMITFTLADGSTSVTCATLMMESIFDTAGARATQTDVEMIAA